MDKQAVTRCTKRTRLHLFQSRWCYLHPLFHNLWQQIHAEFFPFVSTPAVERGILRLAHTVWAKDDAKIHCSELATGQPLLSTSPNFEIFVGFSDPKRTILLPKTVHVSSDFKHSFQPMNGRNLRFKKTNRTLTCERSVSKLRPCTFK